MDLKIVVFEGKNQKNEVFEKKKLQNILPVLKIVVPLHSGKSYTTSSLRIPPGLDRSKGSRSSGAM